MFGIFGLRNSLFRFITVLVAVWSTGVVIHVFSIKKHTKNLDLFFNKMHFLINNCVLKLQSNLKTKPKIVHA